ncbi:MAG: T9SS C-terminal target domain-containing protein, partial [Sphingobacteriales bacterium]
GDALASTLTGDVAHYYLVKVTGQGNNIIKVDLWVDYEGATEPLADFSEPAYQCSGYRKNVIGIDKIRISGQTEPSEASTLYSTFDAIRFSSNFFWRYDYTLLYNNPLYLATLNTKSTDTGNLISWSGIVKANIDYLEVLMKNNSGNYITISPKLSATDTSFTNTSPLGGDISYKVRATDTNGLTSISTLTSSIQNNLLFELTSLTSNVTSSGNLISWTIKNSTDIAYYEVQRKNNAGNYSTLSKLTPTSTSYTDSYPPDSLNTYRLIATYNNGATYISNLITTINSNLPLKLTYLNAQSTKTKNVIYWNGETSTKVDFLEILRKNNEGNFVVISPKLNVTDTSYTDTKPLVGNNFYKLSYTYKNGVSKEFNIIASVIFTPPTTVPIRSYENFEYPVGADYQGVAGSGIGWASPWSGKRDLPAIGGGFHKIVAGNLEGEIGATGTIGGQWVDSYRDLASPYVNNPGNVVWIGFTYKSGSNTGYSGAAFFFDNYENLYVGSLPNDGLACISDCYQNVECLGNPYVATGVTLTGDVAHYYLVKVTGQGNNIIKADLWVDYEGSTEPLADYSEPAYQCSGYRKNSGGIDKIRISGQTETNEASTLYSTYDAIRFSSNFFWRNDYTLLYNNPLNFTKLTSAATLGGNLISWSATGNNNAAAVLQKGNLGNNSNLNAKLSVKTINISAQAGTNSNVDYYEVLRKNQNGDYVSISPKLPASATSFKDTNPLDGTNLYKLKATDLSGSAFVSGLSAVIINSLPLDLTSLTAKSNSYGNLVSWTSASSKNVDFIQILRKNDAGIFEAISPNLPVTASSYTDYSPLAGTNYYKLRSTDKDGTPHEYKFIATAAGFDVQATFYPNPVMNGEFNVVAGNEPLKSIVIFNLSGKKVAFKTADGKVTKINTQSLSKGVYLLEVNGSKTISRNKLVIQ